jgi:cation transporter-like permease
MHGPYKTRNPQLRSEADAAVIVGMLAIGVLGALIAIVIGIRVLENMPTIFAAAVVFALIVFAVMCSAALMRRDTRPQMSQPPVLAMRRPRSHRAH